MDSNQITPVNDDRNIALQPDEELNEFMPDATIDPLAGATGGKKLSGGTMIIVAVVVIAVGGLYSMNLLAKATAAAKLDAQVEDTIDRFIEGFGDGVRVTEDDHFVNFAPGDGVDEVLSEDRTRKQVPLEELQKNPLVIWRNGGEVPPPTHKNAVKALVADCESQRAQLQQICSRLRLKSVVEGSKPMALLEDKVVRVGDSFTAGTTGIKLKVESIATDHIVVSGAAPKCDVRQINTSELTPEQVQTLTSELAALPRLSFRVDLKRN